ncbi:DNA ligase [Alteromonas macleodii]|uniref:Putative dNA ligase n=1 Tax=Alteromonas macleodii TaxID=28108 RepID=A0A6T9Y1P6_ALTMA|nr:DNA ligase [Alteromonas macleodii]CAB9492748.1 putative dNA ligase [Alteromonas macleodii]
MKYQSKIKRINNIATVFMIGICAVTSGCSSVSTAQTGRCIEQANRAEVYEVNTADERLNACLETYQKRRDEERTFGEAFAEDVLISVLDIITD